MLLVLSEMGEGTHMIVSSQMVYSSLCSKYLLFLAIDTRIA